MNKIVIVASFALGFIFGASWAAKAETAAPAPVKATLEFSDGFCTGWNAAQQMEAARATNWRALILLGREKDDPGGLVNVLINSVGQYVLIQPLTGPTNTLTDGRVIDCTPKEAAKDPPKPVTVPEPKKP